MDKNKCCDVNCCDPKKSVKDHICCEWSVPHGFPFGYQTVYKNNNRLCSMFASGSIKYDCGESDAVLVFFLLNGQIIQYHKVWRGSCLAFTVHQFDEIVVLCPFFLANGVALDAKSKRFADVIKENQSAEQLEESANLIYNHADCTGKICITPRYNVH